MEWKATSEYYRYDITCISLSSIETDPHCKHQRYHRGRYRERSAQRIEYGKEGEAVKVCIAGVDSTHPVLPHEYGCMKVMGDTSAQIGELNESAGKKGGVSWCREEDGAPRRGKEGREKSPRFSCRPREAVHSRMGGEPDELIADRPGKEPGRGVVSPLLKERPAGIVRFRIAVNGINKDIRVDE